jgi:hypothetical protein
MYVFEMKNGKQKIAYGETPEDALEILRYRLSADEMSQLLPDKYTLINQRRLHSYIQNLG